MMPVRLPYQRNTPSPITRIISAYRWHLRQNNSPMTYQEFAAELSCPIASLKYEILPETVRGWAKGDSIPSDEDLQALSTLAKPDSWQWGFAQDIKAAKYPWAHSPGSEIGYRVLGRDKPLDSTEEEI